MPNLLSSLRVFSYYHKDTGLLHTMRTRITSHAGHEEDVSLGCPRDHVAIEGDYDYLSQKYDLSARSVVDYQPPPPSEQHEWQPDSKRWQLKPDARRAQDSLARAMHRLRVIRQEEQPDLMRAVVLRNDVDARQRLQKLDDEALELMSHVAAVESVNS